ncbi:MAG: FAD-dependent oxidoreductase [Phycisphaerae bacterium]|nr:FAD-dependent oxidoreductase [Phycisphaerae bacterium]
MRIAIIGSGISGLIVARLLNDEHEITVFEADNRVGGHTHTVRVAEGNRGLDVDTGFIVFNEDAYPNFTRLLSILGVQSQPSDMSFSVSCRKTGLEWAGTNLNTLFAQRRNLLRPRFHRMLRDVMRFNRTASAAARNGHAESSLLDYLRSADYSPEFLEHYLIPMGAAVWSAEPTEFGRIPLRFFVQFFENHGMMSGFQRPTWRVIRGGSIRYVERLIAPFEDRIRTNCPVLGLRRRPEHVELTTPTGVEKFDQVVIASHSDQALRMLRDASPAEREILGAIRFQRNETVLHTDACVMPNLRRVWSSWNYRIPSGGRDAVDVSYHMNRLQGLDAQCDYLVSLNSTQDIDPRRVIKSIEYHHPIFDGRSVSAQRRHSEISGTRRTHYCGAYWGYGFHEDGVRSGLTVASWFGKSLDSLKGQHATWVAA